MARRSNGSTPRWWTTLGSSSATRTKAFDAGLVSELARLLGAADPTNIFGGMLALGGPHPSNALLPGGAPLELSFSERSPASFRMEIQPFGPDVSASERLARATSAVVDRAREAFGPAVAR